MHKYLVGNAKNSTYRMPNSIFVDSDEVVLQDGGHALMFLCHITLTCVWLVVVVLGWKAYTTSSTVDSTQSDNILMSPMHMLALCSNWSLLVNRDKGTASSRVVRITLCNYESNAFTPRSH